MFAQNLFFLFVNERQDVVLPLSQKFLIWWQQYTVMFESLTCQGSFKVRNKGFTTISSDGRLSSAGSFINCFDAVETS